MKLLPKPPLLLPTALLCLGLAVSGCTGSESAGEGDATEGQSVRADDPSSTEGGSREATTGSGTQTGGKAGGGPSEISFGEPVQLVDHLVEGEITVFDFTSPYCPPCRQIAPWLDRLHREREDLSVVKVNINRPTKRGIDWGSPVAQQYGLKSIPAFAVYDADGEVMAEGNQAKAVVIGWLQELAPQDGR